MSLQIAFVIELLVEKITVNAEFISTSVLHVYDLKFSFCLIKSTLKITRILIDSYVPEVLKLVIMQ